MEISAMKFWVGVTDNGWFNHLSQASVDEVNFWQPRGKVAFTSMEPGSLFLFKLKKPLNHIAGGAYFVKSTSLPLSIAWEAFGSKNGATHRAEFESMIRKLVADPEIRDPEIGCTILSAPFFWPKELWIPDPDGFAGSIVRGRYYDTEKTEDLSLWSKVQDRLSIENTNKYLISEDLPTLRFGSPTLVKPRLGQGAFRALVTNAYNRKCALTGESTLPVLEAAHILPFAEDGSHDVSNGMLLRSDFHKLFDLGLITVTPEFKIEISSRIKEEYYNGKAYYRLHGQNLPNLPEATSDRPNKDLLRWHNENRFQ